MLLRKQCVKVHFMLPWLSRLQEQLLNDFFFLQSFCCRFTAVFGIIVLLHYPVLANFNCQTDGLIFHSGVVWYTEEFMADSMTARCPGPVADSWYEAFVLICCVWFSSNIWCHSLVSSNLSCAAMFFVEVRGFLLQFFQNKPHLFSLFLTVLSWTLTFNLLTEACRVWDVGPGVFAVSLSITQSDLGVNLQVRLPLGPPQTLFEQSVAMGSTKQLPSNLKIKMLHVHKAEEGYKNTAKHF